MLQPCEAAYLAAVDVARFGDVTTPTVEVLVLYVPSHAHTYRARSESNL